MAEETKTLLDNSKGLEELHEEVRLLYHVEKKIGKLEEALSIVPELREELDMLRVEKEEQRTKRLKARKVFISLFASFFIFWGMVTITGCDAFTLDGILGDKTEQTGKDEITVPEENTDPTPVVPEAKPEEDNKPGPEPEAKPGTKPEENEKLPEPGTKPEENNGPEIGEGGSVPDKPLTSPVGIWTTEDGSASFLTFTISSDGLWQGYGENTGYMEGTWSLSGFIGNEWGMEYSWSLENGVLVVDEGGAEFRYTLE